MENNNNPLQYVNRPTKLSILIFVAFVICMPLLYRQIFGVDGSALKAVTDFSVHIKFIKDFSETGILPSYPLYHIIVYALSFGSVDIVYLSMITTIVLTGFIALKVVLTYFIIDNEINNSLVSAVASITLLIVTPIVNWWGENIYLGQISPNIWHNPTTISAAPLAIALYFYIYKNILSNDAKRLAVIIGLITLNIFCKPNYVLAYMPVIFVYMAFLAIKNKDFRFFKKALIISIAATMMLLLQFAITYGGNSSGSIIIDPFGVWKHYSPNIVISLLLSIAYPAFYTLFNFNNLSNYTKLSWAVFVTALAQFSLLAESGGRYFHGNWGWGCYISLYILFTCVTIDFIKQKFSWRHFPALLAFIAHLVSGIIYLHKILTGGGYF